MRDDHEDEFLGDDADPDAEDLSWTHPDLDEIRSLEAQINQHPAKRTHNRLRDLGRILQVWNSYSMMLSQLLRALETSEEASAELMKNVGDTSGQDRIVLSLDQGLIAYVAGLGAVVDHARTLSEGQSGALQERYANRTKELLSRLPAAIFLAKLRNYVLHNVAAPWEFSGSFGKGGTFEETRISLTVETLLENKKWWNADAKAYLLASGARIHLSPLLEDYRKALLEHIDTLMQEVFDEIKPSLEAVNELARQRNLLATGGVTDGADWEDRIAHIQENLARKSRGEPELNYVTGLPFEDEEQTQPDPEATA